MRKMIGIAALIALIILLIAIFLLYRQPCVMTTIDDILDDDIEDWTGKCVILTGYLENTENSSVWMLIDESGNISISLFFEYAEDLHPTGISITIRGTVDGLATYREMERPLIKDVTLL